MEPKIILVVEDNPTLQQLVFMMAKRIGYSVQTAGSGTEALQAVREGDNFGLIFMDWSLPDQTGLECTQAIRTLQRANGKRIPIIAMTGNAMDGDRERCLAAGMDDYMPKPFTLAEFTAKVHQWLPPCSSAATELGFSSQSTESEQPPTHP